MEFNSWYILLRLLRIINFIIERNKQPNVHKAQDFYWKTVFEAKTKV